MPRQLAPDEIRAEARAHRDKGLADAAYCLQLARYAIGDGKPDHAAFNLHQAAERAYRALLLVLTLYSPKSHRLTILRSLAENLDSRLIAAWPRDTRFARRCFARLERAYVDARYSNHYEISAEELAWLLDRVGALQETIAAICAERLAGEAA